MNLLSIECSTAHASLCLAGEASYSCEWVAERNHDAHLFPALRGALAALGAAPLGAILVGSGPGSYGGVRVALAAATGVALVRGCGVAPVCSWQALAEGRASILSDAKRGGWTLRRPDGQLSVLTTPEVQQALAGGEIIWSVEPAATLERAGLSLPRCGLVPTAAGLVVTWHSLTPKQQQALLSAPAEPIYVRPPHITTPKHKPWEIRKNQLSSH